MAARAALSPGHLPRSGVRASNRPDPWHGELLEALGKGGAPTRPQLHSDRTRPDRSRRLATPRGDYSLGAHAASIRDLLATIGVESATIVGHSLGGGVALQFFYQFPQRTERLVLISSGGLGREVSPMLRSAALPGASMLLSLAAHPRMLAYLATAGARLRGRGSSKGVYVQALARALRPLEQPGAREAFLQTLRAVIDIHGQRVSARDRLYLLDSVPTMIVWGERDHTIPLEHGRDAHRAIAGSRFETLSRAAHFPHLEDADGLAALISDFLETTEPAPIEDAAWGSLIGPRSPHTRRAQHVICSAD